MTQGTRQKFLDEQSYHWDHVVRSFETSLGFVRAAESALCASPQVNEKWLVDKFDELASCLEAKLTRARHTAEAAAQFSDEHSDRLTRPT
jgi:hypothetical protein